MLRYYSHSKYLRETYDFPVKKICVDAGFTCPNRDGAKGYGGCIYCNDKGSGAPYIDKKISWEEQYEHSAQMMHDKVPDSKFIIYFQAFSNTYAPVDYLENLYKTALCKENVVGISIGTRPDCVSFDVLDLIQDLSQETNVWLEYGVETIHDATLRRINRQHNFRDLLDAYRAAKNRDIKVCLHIINGLPGENYNEILETAGTVGRLEPDGIKMHSLYIESGTLLHRYYQKAPWKLFTETEYVELAVQCLELIPKNTVIQRLIGEAVPERLVAPGWSKNKQRVIQAIQDTMELRDTCQGARFVPNRTKTVRKSDKLRSN